jgi:hypothetical protein
MLEYTDTAQSHPFCRPLTGVPCSAMARNTWRPDSAATAPKSGVPTWLWPHARQPGVWSQEGLFVTGQLLGQRANKKWVRPRVSDEGRLGLETGSAITSTYAIPGRPSRDTHNCVTNSASHPQPQFGCYRFHSQIPRTHVARSGDAPDPRPTAPSPRAVCFYARRLIAFLTLPRDTTPTHVIL